MKKIVKTLIASISLLVSLSMIGCGGKTPAPKEEEISISLNQNEIKMTIGEFTKLIVSNSKDDDSLKIDWLSTNSNVATVDENGYIEAISEGETYIIATHEKAKDTCKIIVSAGYYLPSLHFVNKVDEAETMPKNSKINLSTYILFNDREYYDADVNYYVSNPTAGSVGDDGCFTSGNVSGVETDVTITATWRNFSSPTLNKQIHISVLAVGGVVLNEGEVSDITLFTVNKVIDKEYQKSLHIFAINGYFDGEDRNIKSVELINNEALDDKLLPAAKLTYDSLNQTADIEGLRQGSAQLKVSLDVGEEEYFKLFNVSVNLPVYEVIDNIPYFSMIDGKYYDLNGDSFKSLGSLFPVGSSTIVKGYQDEKSLTIDGDKIFGITLENNEEMRKVDVVLYNEVMAIELHLDVYGKIVSKIEDFIDIYSSIGEPKTVKGYYYLVKDIDGLSSPLTMAYGRKGNYFGGVFEGNGHVVKASLVRSQTDKWGLFGERLTGTVQNVGFYQCEAQAANTGFFAENTLGGVMSNVYLNVSIDATGRRNTPVVGAFASTYGDLKLNQVIIEIPQNLKSDYDNGFYFDGCLGIHKLKNSKDNYIISKSEIGRRYITAKEDEKSKYNMKSYNSEQAAAADTDFINVAGGVQIVFAQSEIYKYSSVGDMIAAHNNYDNYSTLYWNLDMGYPRFKGCF